jgi:hypothetical protein
MTPGKYDLAIYRGDSYQWRFTLWADTGHSVPVDLAGGEAKAEIRDKSAGAVIIALDCTITAPNIIAAVLDADESEAVPAAGVWDLQVTYPALTPPIVRTYVAGKVVATADVTDSVLAPARRG